jgi:AraC-like DNA-binding protein
MGDPVGSASTNPVKASLPEDFLRDPCGRYVLGPTYLVWCGEPALRGTLVRARPDEKDARTLVRLWGYDRHPSVAEKYSSVFDAGQLQGVDSAAFAVIAQYFIGRRDEWKRRVRRTGIVLPDGVPGAVTAGIGGLTGLQHPIRFFRDAARAYGWVAGASARLIRREIEEIVGVGGSVSQERILLRAYLAGNLRQPSLADASRRIGCSVRSLQRALEEEGTGFRAEVQAARLQAAQTLLLDTNAKLTAIARELGYSSLAHFSRWFRQATGKPPSAVRARQS